MKNHAITLLFVIIVFMLLSCGNQRNVTDVKPDDKGLSTTLQKQPAKFKAVDSSIVGKSFACGDYEYTVQTDGTVYISGYIGNETDIQLPTELDGYHVTGTADECFSSNENIISVTVPGQIEVIGKNAFKACKNLKTVVMEPGIKIISDEAFLYCDALTEVTIPDTIYKIGSYAFQLSCKGCRRINGLIYAGKVVIGTAEDFDGHINFEMGTAGIADKAFQYSSGWDSKIADRTVEIPESIQYIGKAAFAGQDNIDYFKVPKTVQEIGNYAMLFDYVNNGYELYYSSATQKIYGSSGSVAEQYAQASGLHFVSVDK